MTFLKTTGTLAVICILAAQAPVAADQTRHVYVRADASGVGTGTNWTDALRGLPPTLERGVIYYVADGSYPALLIDTVPSGSELITVRKATSDDHGTMLGWNAQYGDGTATFASLSIKTKYVGVSGITVTGGVGANANARANPNTVSFISLHQVTARSMFIVGEDMSISQSSFGGFDPCESGMPEDIVMVWDNGATAVPPARTASSRITFDGVTIHDSTDYGNLCAGKPNAGIHADCMQILGGHDITIKNSLFYNCPTSAIIARAFRDELNGLVIENNWFQSVQSPGATINLGSAGNSTISGTNLIRYNTILGYSSLGPDIAEGGTLTVTGNILQVGSAGACGRGTVSYNLFVSGGGTTCGSNTRTGTPQFVFSPSPAFMNGLVPNYRLLASDSAARDGGDPLNSPATDILGTPRYVGSAPDLGAHEFNPSAAGASPSNLRIVR